MARHRIEDAARARTVLVARVAVMVALLGPAGATPTGAARPPRGPTAAAAPALPAPASGPSMERATFVICSPDEPQAERAIEQFIAGRGFGTVLVTRSDGCAELTILVFPWRATRTSQRSTLAFSAGSGARIRVRIVSEGGLTRVSIEGVG